MNLLVISDIHGDIDRLEDILYYERYDRVLFLGDICSYYGNTCDIDVKNRLLGIKAIMVCGNCDGYIKDDLDMPIVRNVEFNNTIFTMTHGHIFNEYTLPDNCGKVLLLGHTHKGMINVINNIIVANPGSISRPRNSVASYIIINDNEILLKDLKHNVIEKINYR